MTPRVSVVVTAFNVEPYIEAALRSVLDQTMPDLELLAVDDGLTDATGALCDRVAATDGRVRVIHQANAGPSVARNAGLAEASGEYVTFLDGDDVLAPRFLETLLDAALRTGAAVAVCDYAQVDPCDCAGAWAGDRTAPYRWPGADLVTGRKAAQMVVGEGASFMIVAWGKLYHRSVWGLLRYG